MPFCANCHEFYFHEIRLNDDGRAHRCPPAWQVRYATDDPEDSQIVLAKTAEEAAQEYLYRHDAHSVHFTERADVLVRLEPDDDENPPWVAYTVTGELVPTYLAVRDADPT